jgi:hypothetical protein
MELSMNDPEYLNIDLETMTGVDLLPWQKQTFDTVYGGFMRGQLMTFASGRNTGKSMLTAVMLDNLCKEIIMPPFEVLTTADVDGVPWYTVSCRKEVSIWIRENGEEDRDWYNHINEKWMIHHNIFDMSQEMLAMTKLRWGT